MNIYHLYDSASSEQFLPPQLSKRCHVCLVLSALSALGALSCAGVAIYYSLEEKNHPVVLQAPGGDCRVNNCMLALFFLAVTSLTTANCYFRQMSQ